VPAPGCHTTPGALLLWPLLLLRRPGRR